MYGDPLPEPVAPIETEERTLGGIELGVKAYQSKSHGSAKTPVDHGDQASDFKSRLSHHLPDDYGIGMDGPSKMSMGDMEFGGVGTGMLGGLTGMGG